MLGHRIGYISWPVHQSTHGGSVDNVSETLGHHYLVSRLDSINDATEIDVYHLIPVFDTVKVGAAANNNSRIVENIVQPTRTLNGFLDKAFHRREIGHIYSHRLRFATGGVDC